MRWLLAACMALLLAACGGSGDSDDTPSGQAKTTLMVYLVASDLTDETADYLSDMEEARASKDVNVLIQIGGGDQAGEVPDIDMQKTRRYRLVPDPDDKGATWTFEALPESQQPPNVAMNAPDTLRDFLQWGARQYPADRYAVVLSDHGGGPLGGFGVDHALGGGETMSLAGMRTAFQQSGVKVDVLGFDACLMATVEVASHLGPYANYLVASEDVTFGWRWTGILDELADKPAASGAELGITMVRHTIGNADEVAEGFMAYSVVDLRRLDGVVSEVERIAGTLENALHTDGLAAWWQMATARREAQDFQSNIFSRDGETVDLQSWVHELAQRQLISATQVAAFDAAYKAAVVYVDGRDDDVTGLSILFPQYSLPYPWFIDVYAERVDGFSPPYLRMVQAYSAFAQGPQMPQIALGDTLAEAGSAMASVSVTQGSTLPPTLTQPYDAAFGVLVKDGVALSMQAATAQDNQVRLAQARSWPSIDGEFVSLLPADEDDDDLYLIPVRKPGGKNAMLIAQRQQDGRMLIRWYLSKDANAGAASATLRVKPGDRFQPLRMDLAAGTLVVSGPLLAAPDGDWAVQMRTPPGAGYSVHLAASNLQGQVIASAQGLPLSVD
jgi:hypothetical protein